MYKALLLAFALRVMALAADALGDGDRRSRSLSSQVIIPVDEEANLLSSVQWVVSQHTTTLLLAGALTPQAEEYL